MRRKNHLPALAVLATFAPAAPSLVLAQETNSALDDWSEGPADVMYIDFNTGPTVIGAIGEDGSVSLDLPETADAKHPLSRVFSCSGDSVTSTDPEATYFITSPALTVGSTDGQKALGVLVVASNREIAASRAGRGTIAKGHYYQWLYTPDTVSIEGVCESDVFPGGQSRVDVTTTYAMSLAPGWNLLEIGMSDIETPNNGFAVAGERTFRTVKSLPSEAQWFFWPEEE